MFFGAAFGTDRVGYSWYLGLLEVVSSKRYLKLSGGLLFAAERHRVLALAGVLSRWNAK